MQLEVRNYDLDTSEPTVLLHEDDCRILSVSEGDRVRIAGTSAAIAIVSVSDTLVRKGTVLIPPSVQKAAGTSVGGMAEVTLSHTPESVRHIRSKMDGRHLSSFGAGSGFLGLPGDVTPPSRFVRAAFYQATAPRQATAQDAVLQSFQILNNFDIPVGIEFPLGQVPSEIPSATQWTSATDMGNGIIYYRTMYTSTIRSINLKDIDFAVIAYQAFPMDKVKRQQIQEVTIPN